MALFKATTKVHEKHPGLNFYGVKVENLQVTDKLMYVKARKKKIQKDFREMHTLDNLKEAAPVKAIRDLFTAMGSDPEKNLNNVYIITVQYAPISDEEATKALEVAVDLVTTSSQGSAGAIQKFTLE